MLTSTLLLLAAAAGAAHRSRRRRHPAPLQAGARGLFPRFLLCLPLLATASAAPLDADSSDWDALSRLDPGTRVEVIHCKLQRSEGTLSLVNAEELIIRTESGAQTLARADVRRVSVPAKSKKRRILMAMALGAAAGAAATYFAAETGDIDIRRDYVVGAGLGVGAAAGAGIGALTTGPKTIYRAR